MKECFITKKFGQSSFEIINKADEILTEYKQQGFDMTLRQLYYQFVSRDIIANKLQEYNRLGNIINDARLAGMLDWDMLVDRTRNLAGWYSYSNPKQILDTIPYQYHLARWKNQNAHIEVWVEKEAMAGIVKKACSKYEVDYFCCRGYVSQSEMYQAAKRFTDYDFLDNNILIYLGDHDPSGIDMTRDITDRLWLFGADTVEVIRVALNMEQIDELNPPPNPAKTTDSRFKSYLAEYGNESWELDALEPSYLVKLIQSNFIPYIDQDKWDKTIAIEKTQIQELKELIEGFEYTKDEIDTLAESEE